MTMTERKVIKAKVGLLELAEQPGSVTQAAAEAPEEGDEDCGVATQTREPDMPYDFQHRHRTNAAPWPSNWPRRARRRTTSV